MGYAEALLGRDYGREERSLQKKAKRKGLWGSIGRTLGGFAATLLTGGAAAPWAMGLAAGAGTLAGGALGAAASRTKLKGGTFMQEDRASLERELGAFGSRNITEALKGGVTAGIGQKLKLAKEGRAAVAGGATPEAGKIIAKGKGFDFGGSFVGKGVEKAKTARLAKEYAGKGWIDPNLQTGAGDVPIVAMDRRMHTIEGQKELMLQRKAPGLFRQTAEGGAPVLQDESLDAILQRQSASATAGEKAGIKSMYGGGGTGIDPSIQSTGNEFIDRQLGSYVEPKHRLSQAQSGMGRGDVGNLWDTYNIEKVDIPEDMRTSLFTKLKSGVRNVGRNIEQGFIEGEKYNQEVPWDVVPREQDISAEPNGGKSQWDWRLSGLGKVVGFGGSK